MIKKEILSAYMEKLVGRVYKILPMFEERDGGLYKYIDSLSNELLGLQKIIVDLGAENEFVILVSTLRFLSDYIGHDSDKKKIRREVFKCIDVVKKISVKFDAKGSE